MLSYYKRPLAATQRYPERLGDINDLLTILCKEPHESGYLTGPDGGLHGCLHRALDASRGTIDTVGETLIE